jgi:hypothetical protein
MRTAERVGEMLLEAIIGGALIRACGPPNHDLVVSANAAEQLGQRAVEISGRVNGFLVRKLNVQAETISMLHGKLAESRTHMKEVKQDIYMHRKAMWELAQIAARAICATKDGEEYHSVLSTVIKSVGFEPIHDPA